MLEFYWGARSSGPCGSMPMNPSGWKPSARLLPGIICALSICAPAQHQYAMPLCQSDHAQHEELAEAVRDRSGEGVHFARFDWEQESE